MVPQHQHLGGFWKNLKWPLWFSLSQCWMHLAKVCLGASKAVRANWLPNFSDQISPDPNGATTPSSWWVLNEPKMTFVIFTFSVLDASCKGVPGCIQYCLGHLVAQLFPPKFSSSKCATASSPLWVLNEHIITFVFFTFWVLDASWQKVHHTNWGASGQLRLWCSLFVFCLMAANGLAYWEV